VCVDLDRLRRAPLAHSLTCALLVCSFAHSPRPHLWWF
jgi:hypothetical protein